MREASDFDSAMEDLGRQFAVEEADAALAEDPDAVLCVRVHIHVLRLSCLNVLAHSGLTAILLAGLGCYNAAVLQGVEGKARFDRGFNGA